MGAGLFKIWLMKVWILQFFSFLLMDVRGKEMSLIPVCVQSKLTEYYNFRLSNIQSDPISTFLFPLLFYTQNREL